MDTKENLVQAVQPEQPSPKKKKRRKKKIVRRIIAIVIVLAVLGGIAFGMYSLFKKDEEGEKEIMTGIVYTGSIQSMVTGSGVTKPADSATIVLSSSGTVQEVFVADGDWVNEGDPLYIIDSSEAQKAVEAAQETVDNYREQLSSLLENYNNLTITAPYAGKLMDVSDAQVGDNMGSGVKIATLVDDSTMNLTLYFSYAYQDSVYVGQSAKVTVPSTMSQISGTVKEISYVDYVSAEGGRFFEVILSVPNPGTLTEGTAASAQLTAGDGSAIYPYDAGKFEFSRKTDIVTKVHGDIVSVKLKNYLRVNEGALLMQIGAEDSDAEISTLKNTLKEAEEKLLEAQQRLDDFKAVAPMSGTVLSCALYPGQEVTTGFTAISIADTSVMTVEAQVDEMNISYVKPGMMVDIYQYGRNGQEYFMGTVSTVSMEGKYENGVSYFPAVITVENPSGTLMSGMYIDYSLLASQSDNCLLVPVQAVKYTEQGTCLFIKADSRPDNALDTESLGIEVPEGYYAVPVTVGLSDNSNAEIIEGVEDGTEVFVQYMTNRGNSNGW
ncbi:MAG: HlyD family efflux transporter periplasmic adaptor subunit [Clostridiales bacterium]|nr:HlyD family efflux transporter periplasmic adaptor subunit [Clostridiales bacterium]